MSKKIFIILVISFFTITFSNPLLATNQSTNNVQQNYYPLEEKDIEKIDFNHPSFSFSVGDISFSIFPFDQTHDALIYTDSIGGAFAIEKVNDYIMTFPKIDGIRLVMAKHPNTLTQRAYGLIDDQNNEILPPEYEWGDMPFGGIAIMGMFTDSNHDHVAHREAMVNKNGQKLTDVQYEIIKRFAYPKNYMLGDEVHLFNIFRSNFINNYMPRDYTVFYEKMAGRDSLPLQNLANRYPRRQNISIYHSYYKKGVLDKKGNVIIPAIYQDIKIGNLDIFAVSSEGNYGYINSKSETLLPLNYQLCTIFRDGIAAIVKDNKIAFIDTNFNIVQDFKEAKHVFSHYGLGDIDQLKAVYLDANAKFNPNFSAWAVDAGILAQSMYILPNKLLNRNYKEKITREEFCELITYALFQLASVEEYKKHKQIENLINQQSSKISTSPFKDVNNPHINLAYYLGIIDGVSKDTFNPKGLLTREQTTKILFQTYSLLNNNTHATANNFYKIKDFDLISSWAVKGVNFSYENDIVKGVGNGNFDPKGNLTIEQAIIMIINLYDKL